MFKSFLTVGIDYYYLVQSSLSYSGSNTKWGFDIRTHSKRYPSISIAYKPYSTFRTFSDTFSIPQRPMFGAVFTGKANYQFKRSGKSWRFVLLLNTNKTVADTVSYANKLMQATCIYTEKALSINSTLGYTEQTTTAQQLSNAPSKMSFVALSGSWPLKKGANINVGAEIGRSVYGLSRYMINTGIGLMPQNKPVCLRANLRLGSNKLSAIEQWKDLYNGYLEMTYKFKQKINRNSR